MAADYVGLVSANREPRKLEKSGFHTSRSRHVDAPLIEELPVALECKLIKVNEDGNIIGQIVNVSVDEAVLAGDGGIDFDKFRPIAFEPARNGYHVLGERVGSAFRDGAASVRPLPGRWPPRAPRWYWGPGGETGWKRWPPSWGLTPPFSPLT